ncbi:MAG: 7-cyano-7-deazaguanine synthase QueC [Elusimicrobiota bacterium]|jgi:7-cyano-7-deazaguanine synthase|nr:7-cyano-7-deazaguanine synthase QueC [Elusimicrobiota bacterium]
MLDKKAKNKINKNKKNTQGKKTAVVLFSGGLDSTTCLYWALNKGYNCLPLNILYGQRHAKEAKSAKAICRKLGLKLISVNFKMPWLYGATSLVGKGGVIPNESLADIKDTSRIPSTYVPARNLFFMAVAASMAEALGAEAIIAGPNAIDFSGYPDCRPAFYRPLAKAIKEGTRCGVSGKPIKILTPLLKLDKGQIAKLGKKLGVPFALTWSCYNGGKKPCGKCDACKLRAAGFKKANLKDE